jgi:hypothetical protein
MSGEVIVPIGASQDFLNQTIYNANVDTTTADNIKTAIGFSAKADKVIGAVSGNLASLDVNGNLADSTLAPSDVARDNQVVKLTTDQEIAGKKTFSGEVVLSNLLLASGKTKYLTLDEGTIKEQELVLADKYLGNSTDTLTIDTEDITLTIEPNLFFQPLQDVVVIYDNANHMHGSVVSYDSTTGEIVVDVKQKEGSGSYSVWKVYLDGIISSGSTVIDNLTTQDANSSLSANQGYILDQNKVDKTRTINTKDLSSNIVLDADDIQEKSSNPVNKYLTNQRVIDAVLTGFSATEYSEITSTDSIKSALEKVQDFINNLPSANQIYGADFTSTDFTTTSGSPDSYTIAKTTHGVSAQSGMSDKDIFVRILNSNNVEITPSQYQLTIANNGDITIGVSAGLSALLFTGTCRVVIKNT